MSAPLAADYGLARWLPPAQASVSGTWLRVRALVAMGHSTERIGRALGYGTTGRTVRRIARVDTTEIPAGVLRRIVCLYEEWWSLVPPERTAAERYAAAAARRWARREGWCTAAGLDDDELDDPGYQPMCTWRRATGTGTATDNPLRVVRHG
jgi:hypothetical protein